MNRLFTGLRSQDAAISKLLYCSAKPSAQPYCCINVQAHGNGPSMEDMAPKIR